MSRCFPYPPPGYLRNGSRGDSVSVSIKHQSGSTKFGTVQPSSKVKERIQVRKYVEEKDLKSRWPDNKGLRQVKGTGKRKLVDSKREDDTEKSDLSEEHGQPVRVCHSSDAKGDEAASSLPKRTVLRFRLPKKCGESDVPANANHSTNSISLLRAESAVEKAQPCALELERDSSRLNVGSSETLSHRSKKHKKELQYEALFRDWVPPPLQFQMDNDSEDWLFGTKKQTSETKRPVVNNNDNIEMNSSSLWPTAQFLPEANVYSMPYTVPF